MLDRLGCVVYKIRVRLMGVGGGWGGGVKGTSFWMYYVGVGVFFPEGEYGKICYQKLESIQPSIFIERKLELLYVELRSTSLS